MTKIIDEFSPIKCSGLRWRTRNKERYEELWRSRYAKIKESPEAWEERKRKARESYAARDCAKKRGYHTKRRYNLNPSQVEKMFEDQGYTCYICTVEVSFEKSRRGAIDHDHVTGRVRKILCNSCNQSLGLVKENRDTLRKMISYLEEHEDSK